MSGFHSLNVKETKRLINGKAMSVMFEIPPDLEKTFAWNAGQHLTLRFTIDGKEVRRSYSISSSPYSGEPLRITVKRVHTGLVSNYINDNVTAHDKIDVMPPFGGFFLKPAKTNRRTHYFFAAGSGITPLFSMLHSVMCAEPYSVAYLIYGNKNHDNIIFKQKLDNLCLQHQNRLKVFHVLSESSIWSNFTPWRKGKIEKSTISALINENPPYAQDAQYYICGPGKMNLKTKAALLNLDVPANRIHMESYGGSIAIDDSIKGQAAMANVNLDGQNHAVNIKQGQTVLEGAKEAGLKPPYSCQAGVCGACRATLNKGTVHLRSSMALEEDDIENGEILTCQALPTSSLLNLSYS